MESSAAAEHRSQVQTLKRVGEKVSSSIGEDCLREVVIVPQPAADGIRGGRGTRPRRIVAGIDRVGVKTQLVVQSLARRHKCKRKILALAVAAGQGEAGVHACLPFFEQPRMQRLLVVCLARLVANSFDRRDWRFHHARFCRDHQLAVGSGNRAGGLLSIGQFNVQFLTRQNPLYRVPLQRDVASVIRMQHEGLAVGADDAAAEVITIFQRNLIGQRL